MVKQTNKITKLTLPQAKRLIPVNIYNLGLKPREIKFVAAYCTNGFVATDAYKAAGYKSKTKNSRASRSSTLLSKKNITEAIRRFIDTIIEPFKAKLEYQIVEVYYKRAFYTIDMFYKKDGTLKELDEIEKEWLIVIDGVDRRHFGSNAQEKVMIYQLANRDKALQTLFNFINLEKLNDSNTLPQLSDETRTKLKEIFNGKKEKGAILQFNKFKKLGST